MEEKEIKYNIRNFENDPYNLHSKSTLVDIKEKYSPPQTLGAPKEVKLAMDNALTQANWFQSIAYMLDGQDVAPQFLGYPYLSSLCQNGLIKSGIDIIANEMTRKFVNFQSKAEEDKSEIIKTVETWFEKFKVKSKFHRAVELTKYNGGCLLYIDIGEVDREELKKPLSINKYKIKKGSFKGLREIEPLIISPGIYNAINPLADDYFNPQTFWIQGIEVHKSRFLYFADNQPTLLLKPVYNFFGVPTAQIVLEYVFNFMKNRDSATRLLNKFSLTAFKSDLTNWLNGGSGESIATRLDNLAKIRTNDSILLVDKETEDLMQLNTPLGGVMEIFNGSLDLIPILFRIPKMKYLQLQQSGMNTGNTEYQNFNDFIISEKEVLFRDTLEKLLKICQLDIYGEIDEDLTFNFANIYELNEKEREEVNAMKANTSKTYVETGILTPQEVKQNLANDPNSGFDNLELEEIDKQEEEFVDETTEEVINKGNELDVSQSERMNGAQISGVIKIAEQVSNKTLSKNAGIQLLKSGFGFNDEEANKVLEETTNDVISQDEKLITDGGEGSGNFGHEGRKGEVGGSGEGSGKKDHTTTQEIIIKGNELGNYSDIKELRQKAVDYYKKNIQGSVVKRDDIGEIRFSRRGIEETMHEARRDEETLLLMPQLLNIIKTAKFVKEETPNHARNDNVDKFISLKNNVKINEKNKNVEILLKHEDGYWHYALYVNRKRGIKYPQKKSGLNSLNESLTSDSSKVNTQNEDLFDYELNLFIYEDD